MIPMYTGGHDAESPVRELRDAIGVVENNCGVSSDCLTGNSTKKG